MGSSQDPDRLLPIGSKAKPQAILGAIPLAHGRRRLVFVRQTPTSSTPPFLTKNTE